MTSTPNNIQIEAPEKLREEMRQLRRRLEAQTIVTDKLLRNAVRDSTRYSQRVFRWQKCTALPLGIIAMFILSWQFGYPVWFGIMTAVMLVGFTVSDYYVQRMSEMDYSRTPLLEIQERLVRQKSMRARRMLAGMAVVVIWFGLFVWITMGVVPLHEARAGNVEEFREGAAIGATIGGVIGGLIGYMTYRRMQRDNTRAIERLRDFTDPDHA